MFNNTKKIEIGILEISSQNKAILEYYFSTSGKSLFKETSEANASAFIIDFDFPGAKENWENISKSTNKPAIILSMSEVDLPSTIWLTKPLTAKAMTDAASKIKEMIDSNIETTITITKETSPVEVTTTHTTDEQELDLVLSEVEELTQTNTTKPTITEKIDLKNSIESLDVLSEEIDNKEETKHIKELAEAGASSDSVTSDTFTPEKEQSAQNIEAPSKSSTPNDKINLDTEAEDDIDALLKSLISGEGNKSFNHDITNEKKDEAPLSIDYSKSVKEETSLAVKETTGFDLSLETSSLNKSNSTDMDLGEDFLDFSLESEAIPEEQISDTNDPLAQPKAVDEQHEFLLNEIDKVEVNTIPESENESADIGFDISEKIPTEETSFTTAEAELQSLLNEIRDETGSNTNIEQDPEYTQESSPVKEYLDQTDAEVRWEQLCGENDDVKNIKKLSFSNDDHMLTSLIDNISLAKKSQQVVRLKYDDIAIVIDRTVEMIYCNLSVHTEEYAEYCYESLDPAKIKVFELDSSEIRSYRKKMNDMPHNVHSIESFIWTTSLLTSRGRLLEKTDISKPVSLKTWPDLTRLEQIPHAMQIAAVLSKIPSSLEDIASKLEIPQRFVFAFYNGALSLNMIEFDASKFKTSTFSIDDITKKNTNRGFFGRLLKRLTR